jgi:hypothetical protein
LKKEAGIAERKLLARNERIQNLEALLQDADRRLSVQNQKFEAQLQAVKERLDQARGMNACNRHVRHLFCWFQLKRPYLHRRSILAGSRSHYEVVEARKRPPQPRFLPQLPEALRESRTKRVQMVPYFLPYPDFSNIPPLQPNAHRGSSTPDDVVPYHPVPVIDLHQIPAVCISRIASLILHSQCIFVGYASESESLKGSMYTAYISEQLSVFVLY